jgi:uncharacterized protein YbjQ (UPF0145 family)
MLLYASEIGANAVIGMRYDVNELMDGLTEVLAYGTAVSLSLSNEVCSGDRVT